jgi:uncharacterized protein HemY
MQEALRTFETAPAGDADFENTRNKAILLARRTLASSYIKLNRWQDAKSVLESQFRQGSYDETMALILIQVYSILGEKNQAVALASTMSSRYPDNQTWKSIVKATEKLPN